MSELVAVNGLEIKMAEKTLKICIVGAGDMGLRHLNGWQAVENAHIVAIVDDVPPRLRDAGRQFGVSGLYSNYQTAILETEPDVVSVCIPTAFHADVSLYALEHGAHVLCEKPIALSLTDADAMVETARRNSLLLTVGFMLRYSQAIQDLKNWVAGGRIGRPILYVAENFMEVRPKILMHARHVNGGPLIDYWCHHFDLWSYLFESQPVSIAGYGAILAQGKPEVENLDALAIDTAGVIVRYASGDIGQLATSWGLPTALSGQALSSDKLIGPQGLITGNIRRDLVLHQANGRSQEINNRGFDWWRDEIAAFAQTIRSGGKPLVTGENGREALRVSLAAIEAIETGQTINV